MELDGVNKPLICNFQTQFSLRLFLIKIFKLYHRHHFWITLLYIHLKNFQKKYHKIIPTGPFDTQPPRMWIFFFSPSHGPSDTQFRKFFCRQRNNDRRRKTECKIYIYWVKKEKKSSKNKARIHVFVIINVIIGRNCILLGYKPN